MVINSPAKAGELPLEFKIPVRRKFFSLAEDFKFMSKTAFLEVPFKVYDSMAMMFIYIPPSAFWRFPSPINPFYLVKDARIKDCDCPDLPYYINILSDATKAHYDLLPLIRSSSPLPPSSPPPPSPRIEYAEKEIQTADLDVVNLKKRKVTGPEPEGHVRVAKAQRMTKFEVNLHIHCEKGDRLTLRKGTGSSASDPIII